MEKTQKEQKEKETREGRKALWGFLVRGIVLLIAGTFLLPTEPASLPKAANLIGAGFMICTILALVIAG